ncbi:MAG: radical SAM protein [Firmicutes bacterium]|nr:radical SAM protein [Bacillota bacterium]MDD4262874.1 radical SAM protein [Bacillota bacterium]MDD4693486.1 radical SAM protein [Bacillota bacterium]
MGDRSKLVFREIDGNNWHLRRESGGGVLIINGSKLIHLNQSAFDFVWHYLKLRANDQATVFLMKMKYGLSIKQTKEDWFKLKKTLFLASDNCCERSGVEVSTGQKEFEAPLRVDLALTYLCNNDCFHCYAGGSHHSLEMDTNKWKAAIDKLWDFGVPQVAFTGGESLLREDLPILIRYAKNRGMITGLITNGRLLTNAKTKELARSGLDFVQITIESHLETVHNNMVRAEAFVETLDGIKNALKSSLKVTTNTTMTALNADSVLDTVSFLLELGVKQIGLNGLIRSKRGIDKEGLSLKQLELILDQAKNSCNSHGAELIWFTPTCYRYFNPLKEGLGTKRCSAASTVLAIEPDGRVMPCQSYFKGIGNINTDSMSDIWHHPLSNSIRNRDWLDEECKNCNHILACGGACPLESGLDATINKGLI